MLTNMADPIADFIAFSSGAVPANNNKITVDNTMKAFPGHSGVSDQLFANETGTTNWIGLNRSIEIDGTQGLQFVGDEATGSLSDGEVYGKDTTKLWAFVTDFLEAQLSSSFDNTKTQLLGHVSGTWQLINTKVDCT